jgi:hypothetical protein
MFHQAKKRIDLTPTGLLGRPLHSLVPEYLRVLLQAESVVINCSEILSALIV